MLQALRLQVWCAQAGLPVPAPRPVARDGRLWADGPDGAPVVLMPFVDGQRRERGSLTAAEAAHLGDLLGRLHLALGSFEPGPGAPAAIPSREALARRWADLRAKAAAAMETDSPLVRFDGCVIAFADYAMAALERVPEADWALGRVQWCHGDIHLDNLLWDGQGRVTAILDFDNAAGGWPELEAMLAWNLDLCRDPGQPEMTAEARAFFGAYRGRFAVPESAWRQMSLAYWCTLLGNTWPAGLRYREPGAFRPEWAEVLGMRLGAAVWLEAHRDVCLCTC